MSDESESLDFHDEIHELLHAEDFRPFVILLTNGARYLIGEDVELVEYRTMYSYLPPKGSLVMFPRWHVCSVEVDY